MSTAPELHKKAQHQEELRQIGERVAQAREWYSVGVLESLEAETRTLHSATEKLLESSNVLEYLTRILIAVTIVVVGEPFIEQLFGIWGLPVFLAVAILGTYYLTRIFRSARD
jgi:hypothetical protein